MCVCVCVCVICYIGEQAFGNKIPMLTFRSCFPTARCCNIMILESVTQMLTHMTKCAYLVVEGRSCSATLSLCPGMILRAASVVISLLHNAVSKPYDAACTA